MFASKIWLVFFFYFQRYSIEYLTLASLSGQVLDYGTRYVHFTEICGHKETKRCVIQSGSHFIIN